MSLLIKTPPDQWPSADITQITNKFFWDFLNTSSNHDDPHITEAPYPGRQGLDAMRTIRSNQDSPPPQGETRASLIVKSELSTALAYQKDANLRAERRKREQGQVSCFVPSPLLLARRFLTSPEFLASDGYVHSQIRAEIFSSAICFHDAVTAKSPDIERNAYARIRSLIDFDKVAAALQTLEQSWKKRDSLRAANATSFIVYHMLASKGYLFLHFKAGRGTGKRRNNEKDNDNKSSTPSTELVQAYLEQSLLWRPGDRYEFRVRPEVRRLPSASELMNELDGVPIAIPGAGNILFQGLRFTHEQGLVGRVSGPPGSGKTSLGLAVAVALAPLGTRTIYLSCEEQGSDLTSRLQTLVPPFIRRTASYPRDVRSWFEPIAVPTEIDSSAEGLIAAINLLSSKLQGPIASKSDCPPGLIPLFVVLDGVHDLFMDRGDRADDRSVSHDRLKSLVDACRQLGAFVLLLSASGVEDVLFGADYLVDFVIRLDHQADMASGETPSRYLTLSKTRRQISRPGSHAFHLSGSKGFRISPHVGSQLEEQRAWRWREPNTSRVLDVLQTGIPLTGKERRYIPLVDLYERSNILITGEGSSGKAALALKLLTAPIVQVSALRRLGVKASGPKPRQELLWDEQVGRGSVTEAGRSDVEDEGEFEDVSEAAEIWDERHVWVSSQAQRPTRLRRVLVLSFLYQEAYYRRVWQSLAGSRSADTFIEPARPPRIAMDVESFSPGYLKPEDFLRIVSDQIVGAELSGFPYFGVLIDGLHNVYLQFPKLERSEMVWPLLYEVLRAKGLTVVTTHTSFAIDQNPAYALQDLEASRRRIGPLLHALVQGADFSLRVDRPARLKLKGQDQSDLMNLRLSRIHSSAALGQPLVLSQHYWDRERCVFRVVPTDVVDPILVGTRHDRRGRSDG